ncbi:ATP phosphoribosyltransferase regulatory subunit [Paenibacillus bovis]|uniref:ATP phosphoribosyltransferase regulatory subunit n=1 Tax=Paenibacillus bovis TaxID=1616788 RepID=A0A172ZC10_9BACL|nr:ATP phosphoribosyltransferase regulatory subunit [Paenibacillus bovis]ANF95185.1 ATP phosphoribosyltransferase regulatory subunit [Paenibacillus bovis]
MSKPKGFEKPTGVRDYLPHVVSKLRYIEENVLQSMSQWGYRQIITPTLEYYDTVGVASSTSDRKLYKMLNNRGTTMVLRSDMTTPIARVMGSLLKEEQLPIRLAYHANVFRSIEEEAGREAEFFQTGAELVGVDSPEGDAEVIALAIACLQAAGVQNFKISLGHVGFLSGLLEEALPGKVREQEALKDRLLNRDFVGFREQLAAFSLSAEQRSELEGLLRLRGAEEICQQALEISSNEQASASIRHLCKVWEVLEAYDISKYVMIDLTMIGNFSYYTGMVFEGYAAELGSPICSGGRYDNLLAQFGRAVVATGFALKTNRILDGVHLPVPQPAKPVMITYDAASRREAFAHAANLRQQGKMVVTEYAAEAADISFSPDRYGEVVHFTRGSQAMSQ